MASHRGQWGRRHVRERLNDRLANLDPLEFERVMADYYRGQGYDVEECGTGGTGRGFDGGIDLKLRRNGEYVVVQCKRHNAYQLTHNPVHELLGVAGTEGADRCILVNTGEFTPYALEVAAKNPKLELIDGRALRRMLPELAQPVEQVALPQTVEFSRSQSPQAPKGAWEDYSLSVPDAKPPPFRVTVQDSRRKLAADSMPAAWVTGAILFALLIVIRQCSAGGSTETRSVPVRPEVSAAQPPLPQTTRVQAAAMSVEQTQSPPRARPRSYTKDELLEQQRRADEAIRVIEATTPEM